MKESRTGLLEDVVPTDRGPNRGAAPRRVPHNDMFTFGMDVSVACRQPIRPCLIRRGLPPLPAASTSGARGRRRPSASHLRGLRRPKVLNHRSAGRILNASRRRAQDSGPPRTASAAPAGTRRTRADP
ncbi:hypothetical protein GCM10018791_60290 [Streptomyces zaomyceticus]|nr:hypothetical protein GCM10018791_60290 [Streptomyces zaomyceticus]